MAKIHQIKCIVVIFSVLAVCCNCHMFSSPSSWAKLQISLDKLSSMKYGNFLVEIYEHANNKATTNVSEKKYFYLPIALLDHKSAVSRLNRITQQPEMRFRVEMWNDKVQDEVVKHLNEIVGHEIKSNRVRVFPLEKVILISNTPTKDYSLSPVWTNYDKSKSLRLYLSCYDEKVCDEMAYQMRSDPTQFHHFKLLYSLSSTQTSQTKQATINIDTVTSGQMVTKLLQKFADRKEIVLTDNDEKKMLTEMATNILMDAFDDSEVGSPDTEFQIYNFFKDLLVVSRTTIKEQSDKNWDSVFWDEDEYRPDRTTTILNEIINNLDKENQKKLVDMFKKAEKQSIIKEKLTRPFRRENQTKDEILRRSQGTDQLTRNPIEKWELANKNYSNIQHNYDSNSWDDVDGISSIISGKMANDSDSYWREEILKEDVEKLLQESKNYVQWDGEKFVPKPVQLSRINLEKFRYSQSFQDRNFRVRYTTAELSAPIKFVEHAELIVTDEWNELKAELKVTTELLNTTVNNLVKSNTELTNVKSDLTKKLEGTKKELEKTRADFSKTVDELSTKLNSTEKKLAEMKISVENLSAELKGSKQELVKTRADLIKTVNELSTKSNANSQRLGFEIKVAEDNLKKELRATSNNLETTRLNLNATRTELITTKSAVADLTSKLNARTSEIVDIGKMPTSCADLQRMGQKISGFFSVKGSKKKMEMLYCDFYPNQNDKQKWIGYVDVKSEPVHFYVQRNSSFDTKSTPIPFSFALVNEGNAMNLTSGKFTAPRPGIYFFSFVGHARFPTSSSLVELEVALVLNGGRIGQGRVEEANSVDSQISPLTLQSTLNLKLGDQVWVEISHILGSVLLRHDLLNHFSGYMLEEDIVASL